MTALLEISITKLLSGSYDGNIQLWDLIKEEWLNDYKNAILYKVFSIVPLITYDHIILTTVDNVLLLNSSNWECDMVIPTKSNCEDDIKLSNGVIAY